MTIILYPNKERKKIKKKRKILAGDILEYRLNHLHDDLLAPEMRMVREKMDALSGDFKSKCIIHGVE